MFIVLRISGGALTTTSLIVIAGVAVVVVISLILYVLINRNNQLLMYEHGLVDSCRGKLLVMRYDNINSLFQKIVTTKISGIEAGTDYVYTLKAQNGGTLVINQHKEAGEYTRNQTFERLMPKAIETYEAGGEVSFGSLTVSKQGLSSRKGTLPWLEFHSIEVNNGRVNIGKKKENGNLRHWVSTEFTEIPNAYVFLTLVDKIHSGNL